MLHFHFCQIQTAVSVMTVIHFINCTRFIFVQMCLNWFAINYRPREDSANNYVSKCSIDEFKEITYLETAPMGGTTRTVGVTSQTGKSKVNFLDMEWTNYEKKDN